MAASGKKHQAAEAPPMGKEKPTDSQSVQIIFTQAEKELLLKACMKYKYTIPAYIQSTQPEVDRLNALIEKLS
jgi:hypothetical protein